MFYSVFANIQDAVKQSSAEPDWDVLKREYPGARSDIRSMKYSWDEIVNGGEFFGGGLNAVVDKYTGSHSYEAQITANIESQFGSENFYRKKFRFHNRQVQGQMVDIPRYLNNDPRYWFSVKKVPMPNRAVRVFAPMGGISCVSQRQMQVCGALTCAICEALEANGISVELWASCCSRGVFSTAECITPEQRSDLKNDYDWQHICHLIKLKDSSQYCDYGMINYITGDSGFYRQIVFLDRIKSGVRRLSSGVTFKCVGGSYNFRKELIPPDEDYNSEADIVVPRIYDIEDAKQWLESNLNNAVNKVNEVSERSEGEGGQSESEQF